MQGRVTLRPVTNADQTAIASWAGTVGGLMSRTHPLDASADRHDPARGLFWYIVVEDGLDVGTVWIEAPDGGSEAVLGVFLGDASCYGRGIGTAAVRLAVAAFHGARPDVTVAPRVRRTNARAIACYRRAGFEVAGGGFKELPSGENVPYHRMVLAAPEGTISEEALADAD